MELRDYVALLRKWLVLIVLCTVAAGVVAYLISANTQPTYEAKATLMVNQASTPSSATGYSDILTSERLARTYASLLISRPVLEATAAEVGLDLDALNKSVELAVTPMRDTQLLEITAQGTDPNLIARVANVLSDVFIERNREMQLGRVTQSRESLEAEIESTWGDIARTTEELTKATDDAQKTRLETSLAQYRSTYSNLVASFQQVKLAEAQVLNNIVVAEQAVTPEDPIGPRTLTNTLLAAVIGMLISFGVIFLIEYLDDTVKTPDDIDRVAGLSTLGAIARLKDAGATRQLIASLRSKAPETEAYRTLRTNIQFSSVDKPIKSLLVTSSSPGEGKSTTTANLAVVMAQTGQRVIVVDTDLRRPVLHKVFSVPNNTGLTTALLAGDVVALEGHLQPTEVDNLQVLTSGPIPPNPSELLGSQRMRHLIESMTQQADLVIFDSPPILAVTDAAVMGRQVDGVLVVTDAGKTREHALASAVSELQKTGANVLGVALNRLNSRRGAYQYYYYYYYSEEEGGKRRKSERSQGGRLPWQRKAA